MLTLNDDGSADIDFPNGPVHISPPTFGGLKRLRAERVRLAREAQDGLAAWEAANPIPEDTEESPADPTLVARRAEDRIVEAERLNLLSTEKWWRLLLKGDETFKGLADGEVPDDVDEWPAALLYDIRPILPPGASVEMILSAQSMPDQWMRHVGNGRSRSGVTAAAGQQTNP